MFAHLLPALLSLVDLPPQPPAAIAPADAYRADLEALTGEEVAGRASGSAGEEQVVAYLEQRMAEIGLQPPVAAGYLQRFRVPDPRPREYRAEATGLRLHWGKTSRELVLGRDALPFAGSADGEARGPVVFAGHGLRINALEHDDYRDLDVRGKVVLVLRGAPGWRDPASPYRQDGHREALLFATKMAHAAERGAVGFLLCNRVPAEEPGGGAASADELRGAQRARGQSRIPAFWVTREAADDLLAAAGASPDGAGPDLAARQRALDAGVALARDPSGALNRDPAGDPKAVLELRVGMEPARPELACANVIGVLRGQDPAHADEYMIIGAHHDHLGRGSFGSLGGRAAVGQVHPGADDNASGVAGLLRAASLLAAEPRGLRRSVVFVAFGAEELGMRGSLALLERGPLAADSMVAMLNLDMIGRAAGGLRIESIGSGDGWQTVLGRLAAASPLDVSLRDTSSRRSDHRRFLRREVPALLFHTGLHAQYHRPTDVASLVQVDEALLVADLVARTARALASSADRVRFLPEAERRGR